MSFHKNIFKKCVHLLDYAAGCDISEFCHRATNGLLLSTLIISALICLVFPFFNVAALKSVFTLLAFVNILSGVAICICIEDTKYFVPLPDFL